MAEYMSVAVIGLIIVCLLVVNVVMMVSASRERREVIKACRVNVETTVRLMIDLESYRLNIASFIFETTGVQWNQVPNDVVDERVKSVVNTIMRDVR